MGDELAKVNIDLPKATMSFGQLQSNGQDRVSIPIVAIALTVWSDLAMSWEVSANLIM